MPIPDRQKQRQEYLHKKLRAYGQAAAFAASGGIGLALIASLVCTTFLLFKPEAEDLPLAMGLLTIHAAAVVVFGLHSFWKYRQGRAIPHVPSLAVQAAYLPPVEILVRGGQEPVREPKRELLRSVGDSGHIPELLLRAARSDEDPDKDLLRAFLTSTQDQPVD